MPLCTSPPARLRCTWNIPRPQLKSTYPHQICFSLSFPYLSKWQHDHFSCLGQKNGDIVYSSFSLTTSKSHIPDRLRAPAAEFTQNQSASYHLHHCHPWASHAHRQLGRDNLLRNLPAATLAAHSQFSTQQAEWSFLKQSLIMSLLCFKPHPPATGFPFPWGRRLHILASNF